MKNITKLERLILIKLLLREEEKMDKNKDRFKFCFLRDFMNKLDHDDIFIQMTRDEEQTVEEFLKN